MNDQICKAFITGAERVAAWADLLDSINVFPIADGDTGRNLKISLAPLRDLGADRDAAVHRLLLNARGNSGNIAVRFFSGFLTADSIEGIPAAARLGRDRAWKAVHDPKPGTMLTVFDALDEALGQRTADTPHQFTPVIDTLEKAVRSTPELLPKLRDAGVVDSGALGMFIYLEGFFNTLAGNTDEFRPIMSLFGDQLRIDSSFSIQEEDGFCVDITLDAVGGDDTVSRLSDLGESVVVIPGDRFVKVHLHTADRTGVKKELESLGGIIRWTDEDLGAQVREFGARERRRAVHIMSDAAGSVTRDDAQRLGMTLLDSYVTVEDMAAPETCVNPADVYDAMRRGARASTSQASEFERHELYRSVTDRHDRVLYLCVGSAFTGNYSVAMEWKKNHDRENRLTVIDTGAASGRLGAIALTSAFFSEKADNAEAVIAYAADAVIRCQEYLFIDTLRYLAAGGRISRTKAFFGNMLNMKPVVTPTAEGVITVGKLRNLEEQIGFAVRRLEESVRPGSRPFMLIQYTDNRSLVEDTIMPEIRSRHPGAEIKLQPLSLTTGVHAGPGTWSLAFLPEKQ
ncbi:MAG: DegV family EDD domain-containing protein [Spirochaetes bacterium]|nr:DegV family EDD domain-containing protein [Spirochaetota bacterium]